VTTPAPATTTCTDPTPCTTNGHCDGAGTCTGTAIAPTYVPAGVNATADWPLAADGGFPLDADGGPNGVCIISAYYCSTTGVQSLPPPPANAGYSNAGSSGCGFNGPSGGPDGYQENFCKSCNGDCTANCP
jgi:hypothetical protein